MRKRWFDCSICGKLCFGYGYNPYPIIEDANELCCEECNHTYVFHARLCQLVAQRDFYYITDDEIDGVEKFQDIIIDKIENR